MTVCSRSHQCTNRNRCQPVELPRISCCSKLVCLYTGASYLTNSILCSGAWTSSNHTIAHFLSSSLAQCVPPAFSIQPLHASLPRQRQTGQYVVVAPTQWHWHNNGSICYGCVGKIQNTLGAICTYHACRLPWTNKM